MHIYIYMYVCSPFESMSYRNMSDLIANARFSRKGNEKKQNCNFFKNVLKYFY
jgi:hypothetical protein